MPSNYPFLVALNGTLTEAAALAGELPENLRDAADVYSKEEITGASLATSGVSTLVGVDGSGGIVRMAPGYVTPEMHNAKGDGAANDTAALTAALAVGLPLRLTKGKNYKVTNLILSSGTILDLNGATITAYAGATNILEFADDATDVAVSGPGYINCNSIAAYGIFAEGTAAKRIDINNLHINAPTSDGIRIRQASDISISDNTVDSPGQHGICLTTTALDFSIDNNKIYNPAGAGIIFSVGVKGSIKGNVIHQPGPSGDGITGYSVDNADVEISGNTIVDSENHGIHVGGQRIRIIGNLVNGASANDGILIGATTTGSSTDPHADSNHCVMSGNVVTGALQNALYFRDVYYSSMTANVATGTTTGVQVNIETSSFNTITGNVAQGGASHGFYLHGGTYNTLTGNMSKANLGNAYRLEDNSGTGSTHNVLTANMSKDDNRGFIESTNSDYNYFVDNVVENPTVDSYVVTGANTVLNNKPLFASAVYDPASLADGAGVTTTVTVTGAKVGDFVDATFSVALSDVLMTAWVSANDTVSVRFQNESGGTRDLSAGTIRVRVVRISSG
jgi:parallel beta-helix repeat protein